MFFFNNNYNNKKKKKEVCCFSINHTMIEYILYIFTFSFTKFYLINFFFCVRLQRDDLKLNYV